MKGCLPVALKIFAGLVILVIALVWLNFYVVHVRYRLTVEVQDGDQIRTGSSVLDVEYPINPDSFMNFGGVSSYRRVVGYAPTVDLGEKGLLFLTLFNAHRTSQQTIEVKKRIFCVLDNVPCLPFAAYAKPGSLPVTVGVTFSSQKAALDELLRQSGSRDVPFIFLPKLARFLDANDQHKLAPVSPDDLAASFGRAVKLVPVSPDDLAVSFGPGVQLKRVILQLTDDPVTPQPQIWPQWTRAERVNSGLSGYEKD